MNRIIIIGILLYSFNCAAQVKKATVKDTLVLGCPMQSGIMKSPSKEGFGYKGDVKMVVTSASDTTLLSPTDGKIDLITAGENGKYEVVMHHMEYNIWLIGVSKLLVKKNDVVKKGQPIGKITPGDEIEFLLFNDEDPVDSKKYLNCTLKE